jgi:hypothetical protein
MGSISAKRRLWSFFFAILLGVFLLEDFLAEVDE